MYDISNTKKYRTENIAVVPVGVIHLSHELYISSGINMRNPFTIKYEKRMIRAALSALNLNLIRKAASKIKVIEKVIMLITVLISSKF
jgi:hypothetical protein